MNNPNNKPTPPKGYEIVLKGPQSIDMLWLEETAGSEEWCLNTDGQSALDINVEDSEHWHCRPIKVDKGLEFTVKTLSALLEEQGKKIEELQAKLIRQESYHTAILGPKNRTIEQLTSRLAIKEDAQRAQSLLVQEYTEKVDSLEKDCTHREKQLASLKEDLKVSDRIHAASHKRVKELEGELTSTKQTLTAAGDHIEELESSLAIETQNHGNTRRCLDEERSKPSGGKLGKMSSEGKLKLSNLVRGIKEPSGEKVEAKPMSQTERNRVTTGLLAIYY